MSFCSGLVWFLDEIDTMSHYRIEQTGKTFFLHIIDKSIYLLRVDGIFLQWGILELKYSDGMDGVLVNCKLALRTYIRSYHLSSPSLELVFLRRLP